MNIFYLVMFILAVCVFVIGSIFIIYRKIKKRTDLHKFSSGLIMIVAVSVWLLLYPMHIIEDSYGIHGFFNGFFISIQSTIRMFLGDIEVSTIVNNLLKFGVSTKIIRFVSPFLSVLVAAAPVLTFYYIINLIYNSLQHIKAELFCKNKNIYVFNELNEASIAIAQSLTEKKEENECLFIFCDAFLSENEKNYNLLTKVDEFGGVTYKEDLLFVDNRLKKNTKKKNTREIAYFLIGEDESENISQAVALASKYNSNSDNEKQIKIYVHALKDSNACILDSLLESPLKKCVERIAFEDFCKNLQFSTHEELNESYTYIKENAGKLFNDLNRELRVSIKRIDPVKNLVWRNVTAPENFLFSDNLKNNKIFVLIIGVNRSGLEFLKTLSWFYQLPGNVTIDIHVVDKRSDLKSFLMGECPELIEYGEKGGDGEARFKITLHESIDVFGYEFQKLLKDNEDFKNLSAVYTCLGDDALNIEASMLLRMLVKRVNPQNNTRIFSIVYNDIHFNNLNTNLFSCELKNPKEPALGYEDYDIDFIGNLSTIYEYDSLTNFFDFSDKNGSEGSTEQLAFFYHSQWALFDAFGKRNSGFAEDIRSKFLSYVTFEYYRNSSVATALHKEMLKEHFGRVPFDAEVDSDALNHSENCSCEGCKRKCLEHARWTCYMRGLGYVYGPKSILAKTHKDLKPFAKLDEDTKRKDQE